MAKPTSRQTLIDYCKRQLGAPVLEINVAEEQIDDLVDDAIQLFHERHFDGTTQAFLKYKITQEDIDRGTVEYPHEGGKVGIATTSVTDNIPGQGNVTFNWYENGNYIKVPPSVMGVSKIFKFEGGGGLSAGMFSIKYQLFLNDIYYLGSTELLTYSMTKSYLEDLDWLLSTQKQIRYNQREDRLYLDIDWRTQVPGNYLILDCYRALDPATSDQIWNDRFLKPYLTALIKKQWGINLSKFQGVKLPGGIEMNGRQIQDDGQREIDAIIEKMSSTHELPPLDMIG